MKRIACTYHLKNHQCDFENQDVETYRGEGFNASLLGWLGSDGLEAGWARIVAAQRQDERLTHQCFGGTYILALYEEKTRVLRIFQDFFGAPLPLYYVVSGDLVYVDTSLRHLLKRSGLRPAMNPEAEKKFLRWGAVPGKETLLAGIWKLMPGQALEVYDAPVQYPISYDVPEYTRTQAKSLWESTLQANILSYKNEKDAICMPISGGYDSNYILWTLYHDKEMVMHLFCIGAERGISELDIVRENMACYPRTTLTTGTTSPDSLSCMDDIVWRMEGAVYEPGIFLQYELGRAMARAGCRTAICGECADQIMHQEMYIGRISHFPDGPLSQDPYAYGSAVVVKKSAVMLGSFGVEGCYPYIDLPFYGLCRALARMNRDSKLYHKRICAKRLPAPILSHIAKVGGSTSLHSLFESDEAMRVFFDRVERLPAFALYTPPVPSVRGKELKISRLIRFVRAEPTLRLLLSKIVSKTRVSEPQYYTAAFRAEEKKLNEYMKIYYLDRFRHLFAESFDGERVGEERPTSQS